MEEILNLKDKVLVGVFLAEYVSFDDTQLAIIESYVNEHLDIENKDFISDLIDFSRAWGLNVNYRKLLSFLLYTVMYASYFRSL